MDLITDLNLSAPDDFYAALVESHKGLSLDESHAFNARLILILANHVGTQAVLLQALEAARDAGARRPSTECSLSKNEGVASQPLPDPVAAP